MSSLKRLLPIILVLALAAGLRLWQLNALPPGLSFDEAADGVQALELMSGQLKLWWPIGGGKEPLMPYTVIPLIAWLGRTPLALRLWGALMGLASVAAIIWLAGVLFPPDKNRPERAIIPFAAGLGLATAFWHVVISRIAFRANCLPLVMSLAIGLLWRGLQTGRRRYFLAGGAFTGGLIYTYLAGRLVPPALAIFLILEVIIARRQKRPALAAQFGRQLMLAVAAAALVAAPMGIFYLTHPGSFSARAQTVSIFSPAVNNGDLLGALGRTTLTTLGTYFALTGDPNPMTNIPGAPELGLALAALFTVGLILSIKAEFSNLKFSMLNPELLLLVLWPVMILPAVLAPEGAPHHLRLIGAAPAVYLLVGLGTAQTVLGAAIWLNRIRPVRREWVVGIILLGIFGFTTVNTARDYFSVWANQPELYQAYDVYAVELVAQMAVESDPGAVYVIPMDLRAAAEARHYTLDYLYQGRTPFYYLPVDELSAAQRLNAAVAGKTTLRLVRWTKDKHQAADERELVTFLLATGGASLTGAETFPAYTVETYRLPESGFNAKLPAIDMPQVVTLDGRLQVRRSVVLPALTPDGQVAVAVAMTLAPIAVMDADYKASVRLIAPDGAVAAQKDRALLHNWHQPTSLWPAEEVNEYYLLPLPKNAPAGAYTVTLLIYHPDTLAPLTANGLAEIPLGVVTVGP